MNRNPVVHFEMPYDDQDRAAAFYEKAFGWNAKKLGEAMGNYVVVHTTDTDAQNMVTKPGTINGGLFKKSKPEQGVSVVISVDDINAAMQQVKDAGGTVLGGSKGDGTPDDIPGIGLYSSIVDTEGNRVGLLQPHRA
jgi:predicted enzyme related to lactoylglutathione lyase